jgi:hypothetical protein
MVEWVAGNRIIGTTAERPNFGLPSGSVGGWVELARTTLGTAGDVIDITGLADKRYLMVLTDSRTDGSGNILAAQRYNGDGGYNYRWRYSNDRATDAIGNPNAEEHVPIVSLNGNNDSFAVSYIANKSDKEKLVISNSVLKVGTGCSRTENTAKWTNTSAPINRVYTFERGQSGKYAIGSEVVVLGWDPTDTHTTNFWEELASVNTGAGEVLDSGTFAAKKYLWFQFDIVVDTFDNTNATIRFNSDPNGNYARRLSQNGMATDNTATGQTHMTFTYSGGKRVFGNYFVINNSSNEKLAIGHTNAIGTAANSTSEGAGVAPRRVEVVGKWANTSSQITQIEVLDAAQGDLGLTSGTIKVWGSD